MTSLQQHLTDRERALATSGLDTLENTFAQDERLQQFLAIPFPDPQDAAGWERLRTPPEGARDGAPALPDGITVQDTEIAGVPCRVVEPAQGEPTGDLVHLHGGGWTLGSHLSTTGALAALVAATGLRAIGVGYRLAPETLLPQIIRDCVDVARAVAAEDTFHAIAGDSAGAHLAATTLIRLRDEGHTPFRAAVLSYGVYDLGGTWGRLHGRHGDEVSVLGRAVLRTDDPAVLRDPQFSPLFADLRGLPPARFVCGTRDGLLEDTLMMEARWRTVAPTELDLVAAADHAFDLMPGPTAAGATAAAAAFLRRRIADGT